MMENTIAKVVEQMIKELEGGQWSRSDRLQLVLNELVKIRVAEIESARLSSPASPPKKDKA